MLVETEFNLTENTDEVFRKYAPIVEVLSDDKVRVTEWDIPFTIKELSYLTHSHYRYYGKFPSVLAGKIIDDIKRPSEDHYILDNFCGSGTTLLEAKLRGVKSYGVDINWISVLASNVKVRHVNIADVKTALSAIVSQYERDKAYHNHTATAFTEKWFEPEAASALTALSDSIYELEKGAVRDFLFIAFIGIVRRVSKAFDGEVRPHINKAKKPREVLAAFSKKVFDMCADHANYMSITKDSVVSESLLSNNLSLPDQFNDGKCYLVISHPPYLNSFNYTPVFSLELFWGKRFEHDYSNSIALYKEEMKAHPADETITEKYFKHLENCYLETFRIQCPGAYLAVVIGDCTRSGKLISVLDKTIEIVERIGYTLVEVNYRTTHYGLGKYAYSHRADYHGDEKGKKDGVIVFRR